nr:MAG TPA: hypothetical protein [Caudoviricetes sp.]
MSALQLFICLNRQKWLVRQISTTTKSASKSANRP